MRKVVAGLFISLDGVTQSPDRWQFDHFDQEMMAAMRAQLAAEDAVILGRVTYQEWAAYWPTSTDEPYASHINHTPKYVFSSTLDKVEWQNSTLVRGGLAEELARLRRRPGRNIGVAGSPTLVEALLRDGLLDELTLMIHPVVVGGGRRLFSGGGALRRLSLIASKATGTGVIIATYRPAPAAAPKA